MDERRSLRHRRLSARAASSPLAAAFRRIIHPPLPEPLVPWGSILDVLFLEGSGSIWSDPTNDRTLPTRMEVDLLERDVLDVEMYREVMDVEDEEE